VATAPSRSSAYLACRRSRYSWIGDFTSIAPLDVVTPANEPLGLKHRWGESSSTFGPITLTYDGHFVLRGPSCCQAFLGTLSRADGSANYNRLKERWPRYG